MGKTGTLVALAALGLFEFAFLIEAPVMARQKSAEQNKTQPLQVSKESMENNKAGEAPFMCVLGALDAKQRERHQALAKQLHESIQEVKELPNGYAFRLPGDTLTILSVAEWTTFERLCCPFFTFALEIDGEGKPLWLRMTGRDGVKEFMRSELGIEKIAK
jgi:hypothetical protein